MRLLEGNELKTFKYLVGLSQQGMHRALTKFLRSKYPKVISKPKFIYAEGDIPIALLAHMDTVFKKPASEVFYDTNKNVIWSPNGLGADDRAGIFSILTILKSGLRPHIIFTTDEEIGGIGAEELAKEDCPFRDLRYMIQLDRRGAKDCVFYDCDNEDFVQYVSNFGFEEAFGSFTDICSLGPAWGIAGVNLSVGYRDEHSTSEILFVDQMFDTIDKVKEMLKEEEAEIPCFEFIPSVYSYSYYLNPVESYFYSGRYKCSKCGKSFMEEELFPVYGRDGTQKVFCPDCISSGVSWCKECGMAFESDPVLPKTMDLCPICKEKNKPKICKEKSKSKKCK